MVIGSASGVWVVPVAVLVFFVTLGMPIFLTLGVLVFCVTSGVLVALVAVLIFLPSSVPVVVLAVGRTDFTLPVDCVED